MPALFEADCLVIIAAIAAVSLPLQWPRPHWLRRLRARLSAHRAIRIARVKARGAAKHREARRQAEFDAALTRVYDRARLALLAQKEQAEPQTLEEFYAQL